MLYIYDKYYEHYYDNPTNDENLSLFAEEIDNIVKEHNVIFMDSIDKETINDFQDCSEIIIRGGVSIERRILRKLNSLNCPNNNLYKAVYNMAKDFSIILYWFNYVPVNRYITLTPAMNIFNIIDNLDVECMFVKTVQKHLYSIIGKNANSKLFDENNSMYLLSDPKKNVIVSEYIDIASTEDGYEMEYRIYVFNCKIVSISPYFTDDIPLKIIKYAQEKVDELSKTNFPKTYVVDLCIIKDGSIDIVEFNSYSSSGRYNKNKPEEILILNRR